MAILCCVAQKAASVAQMTFLFLTSVLFGSTGGNGRLYRGVQHQYYIETRTDDLFSISHFNFLWEQGRERAAALLWGAGSVLHLHHVRRLRPLRCEDYAGRDPPAIYRPDEQVNYLIVSFVKTDFL